MYRSLVFWGSLARRAVVHRLSIGSFLFDHPVLLPAGYQSLPLVAIIGPVLLLFICRRTAAVNRVKGYGSSRIEREREKGRGRKKWLQTEKGEDGWLDRGVQSRMTTVKELSQVTIREGAWKRGSNLLGWKLSRRSTAWRNSFININDVSLSL